MIASSGKLCLTCGSYIDDMTGDYYLDVESSVQVKGGHGKYFATLAKSGARRATTGGIHVGDATPGNRR